MKSRFFLIMIFAGLGLGTLRGLPATAQNAGSGVTLTHSEIAEANKPGTVQIRTVMTSTIRVPQVNLRAQL